MKKVDLERVAYCLAVKANVNLRKDCLYLLKKAYLQEKKPQPKEALKIILDNAYIAFQKKIPLCQDTGLPLVFVRVPKNMQWNNTYIEKINKGIKNAYSRNCFRSSSIYPFSNKSMFNPKIIHVEFTKNRTFSLIVFPKGFGSENKSTLRMFNPTVSTRKIFDFIVDSVKKAGPEACPPFFIGIGIGGTSDYALFLAKEALLERMDRPNRNKLLNLWEEELLKRINEIGIGPMGLGGKFTALAVKIKMFTTHIAGLPIGVNISCHALRSASFSVNIEKIKVV